MSSEQSAPRPNSGSTQSLKPRATTWALLLVFALGSGVSWYLTRRHFLAQLKYADNELAKCYPAELRLKAAAARQIFLGKGLEWAEVQFEDVPFRVIGSGIQPVGDNWTFVLCEIKATSEATQREVPHIAVAEAIKSEEIKKACETYRPGRFMVPGNWQ